VVWTDIIIDTTVAIEAEDRRRAGFLDAVHPGLDSIAAQFDPSTGREQDLSNPFATRPNDFVGKLCPCFRASVPPATPKATVALDDREGASRKGENCGTPIIGFDDVGTPREFAEVRKASGRISDFSYGARS